MAVSLACSSFFLLVITSWTFCEGQKNTTDVIYVSGGTTSRDGCFESDSSVHIFDLTNRTWCFGESMPEARAYHGSAYFKGKIYIIGGTTYYFSCDSLMWDTSFAYIPDKQGYGIVPPLKRPMTDVSAFVIGNNIYALGNMQNYSLVTTFFNGISWSDETVSMSIRKDYAAAAWKDLIWVIGGSKQLNAGPLSLVESWNVTTGQWMVGPSTIIARLHASAAVVGNYIYVCAGQSSCYDSSGYEVSFDVNTCECLTLNDDGTVKQNWTFIASLPSAVDSFHLVTYNGTLLAFGGNILQPKQVVRQYNPLTNTWSNYTDSPDPQRMKYSAAVVIENFPLSDMECVTLPTPLSSPTLLLPSAPLATTLYPPFCVPHNITTPLPTTTTTPWSQTATTTTSFSTPYLPSKIVTCLIFLIGRYIYKF